MGNFQSKSKEEPLNVQYINNPLMDKGVEDCESEKINFGNSLAQYSCIAKIGSGSFGQVYKIRNETNTKEYALKVIELQNDMKEDEEEKFYKLCFDCENNAILTPIKTIKTPVGNIPIKVGFILELMNGDLLNLKDEILRENLDVNKKYSIFINMCKKVLDGLIYLHNKNIFHGDLKPENILFKYSDDPFDKYKNIIYKISDFGLSCFIKDKPLLCQDQFAGTPAYMDPVNVVDGINLNRFEPDIYAICLTFIVFFMKLFYGDIVINEYLNINLSFATANLTTINNMYIYNNIYYETLYSKMLNEFNIYSKGYPPNIINLLNIFFNELVPFPYLNINGSYYDTKNIYLTSILRSGQGKYRSTASELLEKVNKINV